MNKKTAVVFGGSGFLGRHLVRRLAAKGFIVRAAVRDTEAASFLKVMGNTGQIRTQRVNITDRQQVKAAVEGAGIAVNLVGVLAERGRQTFAAVHHEGAANIARAAQETGVKRLIHVSALGADLKSPSRYASSKAAGEEAVKAAFANASIVRPSVVFGAEDNFFNLFASLAVISPALPLFGCPALPKVTLGGKGLIGVDLYGDGGTRLQPVYVGDVADAIMKILDDPKTMGKTYELGGPKVYSYKEIMELILRQTGRFCLLLPVPFAAARFAAWFLEKLPNPLLTGDQLLLLQKDNVVGKKALSFSDLGLSPVPAETILPSYLCRFRPQIMQASRA